MNIWRALSKKRYEDNLLFYGGSVLKHKTLLTQKPPAN